MPKNEQEMEPYYRPGTTEPEYRPKGTAAAEEAAKAAALAPEGDGEDEDEMVIGNKDTAKSAKKAALKK